MLDAAGRLGKIIVGMNKALGEIPVTVKLRTGVKEGRNNAHKLMPRISAEWGAAAMTVRALHQLCMLSSDEQARHALASWTDKTAEILQARRLGLHQTLRGGCESKGGTRRS